MFGVFWLNHAGSLEQFFRLIAKICERRRVGLVSFSPRGSLQMPFASSFDLSQSGVAHRQKDCIKTEFFIVLKFDGFRQALNGAVEVPRAIPSGPHRSPSQRAGRGFGKDM